MLEDGHTSAKTMALFPEDRPVEINDEYVVQIRLKDVELRRPRQWGTCWLACWLYKQLGLDKFWLERLPPSRKGTRWDLIIQALCCYRLIDPGSEWRLHRHWYDTCALADLLGASFELVEIHKLYECLDRLLEHKRALFDHLTQRWKDMFNAKFDVLLYDLTSTYFESNPRFPEDDKRKFGYTLHVTLRCRLHDLAPGLTPRAVLEKFSTVQMIDIHLPTTDNRTVIMSRYTKPEPDLLLLLKQLQLSFPDQPPPKMAVHLTKVNKMML